MWVVNNITDTNGATSYTKFRWITRSTCSNQVCWQYLGVMVCFLYTIKWDVYQCIYAVLYIYPCVPKLPANCTELWSLWTLYSLEEQHF